MIKSNYNSFFTCENSKDNSSSWNALVSNKNIPQEVVSKICTESHFVSPDLSIKFANIKV